MTGTLVGETVFSAANRRRFEHWTWVPHGDGPFPLLLLLHGVYDAGGYVWWHHGKAVDTVERLVGGDHVEPAVVVMAGDTGVELGSGYCDWHDGTTKAETYLMAELLPWLAERHPLDGRRWVSGLSMGGYGAYLLALRNPGTFESVSATSAFFDPARLFDFVPDAQQRMWDGSEGMAAHDVFRLVVDGARRAGSRFALDCGTDDRLLDQNRRMHDHLATLGVEHGYAEHPGGHTWDYWADHLEDHVRFHNRAGGALA